MNHLYRVIRKELKWNIKEPFQLGLFGDVHYDAASCDRDRFHKFLKQAERDKLYLFGMGDYHDFATAMEQKQLKSIGLHETTMESFDYIVQERNRAFAAKLAPCKDRLLGLIGGNHTWKLENGKYADEDLAERLKTEYLGWLCVYNIGFDFGNNHKMSVYIVLCHGTGGGKLAGTSINKIDDMKRIFPFADLYAFGHDHQRGCWPTSTLWPTLHNGGLKIKEKRQYLIRTGSFMKSYQEEKSQYTTAGLMRPADLGAVRINMYFERKNSDPPTVHIESVV